MLKTLGYGLIAVGILIAVIPIKFQSYSGSQDLVQVSPQWIIPTPSFPETLDPQLVLTSIDKVLLLMPFSRLIKISSLLEIESDLVSSWEFSVQEKQYTFKIREGTYFQDGQPVKPEDILFSFHQWAKPGALDANLLSAVDGWDEYRAGKAKSIRGLQILDQSQFRVNMKTWDENFVRSLSLPRFVVYPNRFRGKTEAEYFRQPIGTGPFQVQSYNVGQMNLKAHSKYHFGSPAITNITVSYMKKEAAINDFLNGKLNNLLLYEITSTAAFGNKNIVIEPIDAARTYTLILNLNHPWLRRRENRLWLASHINREQIIESCFPDSRFANSFIPPGIIGSNPPARTRETEKYIPTKPVPKMVTYIVDYESNNCLRRQIETLLKPTSMTVTPRSMEDLYQLLLRRKLYLWIESFEFKNEDAFTNLQYFTDNSPEYLLGKPIPELKALFDLVASAQSNLDRAELYRKIDQFLTEEGYVVPLYYFRNHLVYRPELHNIHFIRESQFSGDWHKIYIK